MKTRLLLLCFTGFFLTKIQAQTFCNGYMLSFDGSDDYIQLQTAQNFTSAFSLTVSIKVNTYPETGKLYTLISKSSYYAINPTDFPFSLILASDGRIYANLSKGDDYLYDGQVSGTSPLSLNEWHSVSFVYKANNYASLYIDGVLHQSLSIDFTISENNQQWDVGRHPTEYDAGVGTSYFKGYIDEVAIWNTNIGQEEITEWKCKAITHDHPDYASLISYYRFDEGTGSALVDSMDNANGIVYGAAWMEADNSCFIKTSTWYQDADGDGFGNPAVSQMSCTQPEGHVADNTDCDDTNNAIYPGAPELQDGKDNDCDGETDEGLGTTWYEDADGDGFGNPAVSQVSVIQPDGYVADNTDCDDTKILYADNDGDGYGSGAPAACGVEDNTDCDDNEANIHPGATEICGNGIDEDCDGNDSECNPGGGCPPINTIEFGGSFGTILNTTRNLENLPTGNYVYGGTEAGALGGAGTYVVTSYSYSTNIHGLQHWDNIFGHTTGSIDDAYLAVNGSDQQGIFYEQNLTLSTNTDYHVSLWAINAITDLTYTGLLPNIGIIIRNLSDNAVVASFSTGGIAPTRLAQGSDVTPDQWHNAGGTFNTGSAIEFKLEVFNISAGSNDNDFAIDDISIVKVGVCLDSDGDGVIDEEDCAPADATKWQSGLLYIDTDGDNYSAGQETVCYGATIPLGYNIVSDGPDCDDYDPHAHAEHTFYADYDGDGFGDPDNSITVCSEFPPMYYVTDNTDCNDADPEAHADCGPLPVQLVAFSGSLQNSVAQLKWQTAVEDNVKQFELEKSTDGKTFSSMATLRAKGNNSNYTYSLVQAEALDYYRLKIVDNDVKLSYSNMVVLRQNADAISLFPNPARTEIYVTAVKSGEAAIYNATGVLMLEARLQPGQNRINISRFAEGAYFMVVDQKVLKFIKQ